MALTSVFIYIGFTSSHSITDSRSMTRWLIWRLTM